MLVWSGDYVLFKLNEEMYGDKGNIGDAICSLLISCLLLNVSIYVIGLYLYVGFCVSVLELYLILHDCARDMT